MITDRFSRMEESGNFIRQNVILKNIKDVCGVIPMVSKADGSVEEIEYISSVPDDIKQRIKDVLGVEYTSVQDGYVLTATNEKITIYAEHDRGAFYGLLSLRERGIEGIGTGIIYSYPSVDFRMMKLYLPSRKNIPFLKKVIDLCAFYGYNAFMFEIGGAMEYKTHPEINEGWLSYSREASEKINHPEQNPYFPFRDKEAKNTHDKNSIHCENGGGDILTQEEVRDIIAYCRDRYMEVIPEVPSFTHSDYLLVNHRELAEWQDDLYPDTYCPSNPGVYTLLFDLLTEIIEVFQPKRVNIGHDEVMACSCQLCDACKTESLDVLYYKDIMKIYGFLKEQNVKTMMWCEQLLDCTFKDGRIAAGSGYDLFHKETGEYLGHKDQIYHVRELLPKDMELLNWYWSIDEAYDAQLLDGGFTMSFCNFDPLRCKNIVKRLQAGVHGIGLSNWSKVDDLHLHRNGIYTDLVLSAMIMWNQDYDEFAVDENLTKATESLYRYRKANAPYASEVVHTFTKDIPFVLYLDGFEVDEKKNIIGSYDIEYADGTTEQIPMEYGKTIGYDNISRTYEEQTWCYSNEVDRRILDTGLSASLIFEGARVFYQYGIFSDKEIRKVSVHVADAYKDYVEIKEILIR